MPDTANSAAPDRWPADATQLLPVASVEEAPRHPDALEPGALRGAGWPTWLAAAAALTALGWLTLAPVADTDLWWQIATGREALLNASSLPVDPFSASFGGQPWVYKDLGAAAGWFLAWSAGGAAGVIALKAALVGATTALLGATLRLRGASGLLTWTGVAWFAAACAVRIAERSEWWSWLALSLGLLVVEAARARPVLLWWLVPLTAAAANLHRGAILLPGLAAVAAVATALEPGIAQRPVQRLRWLAVPAACGLALLATPHGLALPQTALHVVGAEVYRELLGEWEAPTLPLLGAVAPFLVVAAGMALPVVVQSLYRRQHANLALSLWWLLSVGLASRSLRFLPVLALPSLLLAVPWLERGLLRTAPKVVLSLGVGFPVLLAHLTVQGPWPTPQLSIQPRHFPLAATAFAREHKLGGPVLHDFDDGGWILWAVPEAKVLIDGRNDQVYPPAFFAQVLRQGLNTPDGMRQLADQYRVDWLWLRPRLDDASRAFVEHDPNWSLVFVSEHALILVRKSGRFGPLAQTRGYAMLRPSRFSALVQAAASGQLPAPEAEQLQQELARAEQDDPQWPVPREALRFLHTAARQPTQAGLPAQAAPSAFPAVAPSANKEPK